MLADYTDVSMTIPMLADYTDVCGSLRSFWNDVSEKYSDGALDTASAVGNNGVSLIAFQHGMDCLLAWNGGEANMFAVGRALQPDIRIVKCISCYIRTATYRYELNVFHL
jgi:hypothetical protein